MTRMNWKEISESYPKAWEEFKRKFDLYLYEATNELLVDFEWIDKSSEPETILIPFYTRVCYDHFDSLGIRVTVDYEDNFEMTSWAYRIGSTTFEWYGKDRLEVETAAFTHAFQIRESQLP